MTLFWGALAASFVAALGLWALGQWNAPGRDPFKIGSLTFSLMWFGITMTLAITAWMDLGEISELMKSGHPDLAAYADKVRAARNSLSVWSVNSVFAGGFLMKATSETTSAIKNRRAKMTRKIEETHA